LTTRTVPISEMLNIRVFYNKKGRAKYISHLDITRCMQRALKRAGLPVWYTEGFNPHIYLTFALPLSLGYESESETMDLRLVTPVDFNEVKDRLNAALPPDIRVTKVQLQKNKPEVIKKALYEITLKSDTVAGDILKEYLEQMFAQEKIEVMKKTKKGNKLIDIKPDLELKSVAVSDYALHFRLLVSAGIEKNINPTLLTDALIEKYNLDGIQISVLRKAIYDENGNEFE
jgi:radical SAM-linked protein